MGHGLRGVVTAWLGLIVLQTVSTSGGSGRVASLFTDIDRLVRHALSPDVPAIPNLAAGQTWGSGTASSTAGYVRPTGTLAGNARSPVAPAGGPGRAAI